LDRRCENQIERGLWPEDALDSTLAGLRTKTKTATKAGGIFFIAKNQRVKCSNEISPANQARRPDRKM
jgi:hypothetical protein